MGFEENDRFTLANTPKVFLNREDITRQLSDAAEQFHQQADYYHLYEIYGIGGIGKSRLVDEAETIFNQNKLRVIRINLAMRHFDDMLHALLYIRKQISKAPIFDYVFCKYWTETKHEQLDPSYMEFIQHKYIKRATSLAPYGEQAIALLETLKEGCQYLKYSSKIKPYDLLLANIPKNDEQIRKVMPRILAKELELANPATVYIFDGYERIKSHLKSDFDWVRVFINSFDVGLFIVTSREKLDWFQDKRPDSVSSVPLNEIPDNYVRQFLLSHEIPSIYTEHIIEKTQCIPIFLDLALSLYEQSPSNQAQCFWFKDKHDLIRKFTGHLDESVRRKIEILAVGSIFNKAIFDELLIKFDSHNVLEPFDDFCRNSLIIEKYPQLDGIYRINEIIANNISHLLSPQTKTDIVSHYIEIVAKKISPAQSSEVYLPFIKNCFDLCDKYNIDLASGTADSLFDLVLFLLEAGWAKQFYEQISDTVQNSNAKDIISFLEAVLHRNKNISKGIESLQRICVETSPLSVHRKTIKCEINYLTSIIGNYNQAETLFNSFYHSLTPSEKSSRYYIKGAIYYADMLMLRGRFKEAVCLFEELRLSPYFEVFNVKNCSLYYEICKMLGHCYKFNLKHELCIRHYRTHIDQGFFETKVMKAYRLTTEMEINCFFDAEAAMENFEDAVRLNSDLSNYNNLGKVYYSMAIALLMKKNSLNVNQFIEKSFEYFLKTQYIAGTMFSLLAKILTEYAHYGQVSPKTEELLLKTYHNIDKIYEFLLLPLYLIKKSKPHINKLKKNVKWLNFSETQMQFKQILNHLLK